MFTILETVDITNMSLINILTKVNKCFRNDITHKITCAFYFLYESYKVKMSMKGNCLGLLS